MKKKETPTLLNNNKKIDQILLLALSILQLQILVSVVGNSTTGQDKSVETNTEAAVIGGPRARGVSAVGAGGRVTGLDSVSLFLTFCKCNIVGITYHALQLGNIHPIEQFTGLVTVTDILEGFCCVLTADVEEDFLTTTKYHVNTSLPSFFFFFF